MKRRTRTQSEEVRKNRQLSQIFVTVDESKTFSLMVSPFDKVDDVMKRIRNNVKSRESDVYMTCEGRVLRWSDELMGSGVGDGCTVQIMNMMRGGGKHRNKKNRAENKPTTRPKSTEPVRGQQEHEHDEQNIIQSLMSRESAEDAVIRHFEETEGIFLSRKIVADLAEGSNSDVEPGIQICTELTGLDDEHKKTKANGIRQAVGATRRDTGREPTAEQGHGKEVRFMEEEKEAQEAREWQERFVEKRRRAEEAPEEEQEEKRCEEDDDGRVSVVPDMEAGSSYLQTTDPRAEVEKIVMDGL